MRRQFWGFLLAAAVALGVPALEVANACRREISEGCVWGKALFWVNVAATFVIVGVPLWILLVWRLRRRSRAANAPVTGGGFP